MMCDDLIKVPSYLVILEYENIEISRMDKDIIY